MFQEHTIPISTGFDTPSLGMSFARRMTMTVELQAQVASQSVTAAALTLDAHLEKLRELRDEARQRGQLSAGYTLK